MAGISGDTGQPSVHAAWRMAQAATAARHTEALLAAEALLTDIVRLAEARTLADLGSFREELSARRRVNVLS